MADVRCQMCGKSNPAERETCQYCAARLKPLNLAGTPAEVPPVKAGDAPVPKKTSELESTLPDWLRSLRDEAVAPHPVSETVDPFLADAESDRPDAGLLAATEQPAAEDNDNADWLDRVRQRARLEDSQAEPAASEEPAASAGQESEDDWLNSLRSSQTSDNSPQPSDWLQELSGAQPAPAEGNLNDWLSGLPDTATEKPSEEPELPSSGASLTGWLNQQVTEPAEPSLAPAVPEKEDNDWLSSWGVTPLASQAEDDNLEQPASLPDWLSGLKTEDALPSAARSQPDMPTEMPAALDSLANSPLEQDESVLAAPNLPGDLPDWMSGKTELPDTGELSIDQLKTEMPDWLASRVDESASVTLPAEPTLKDETSDWLSSLPAIGSPFEMPSGEGETPAELTNPFGASEQLPDWLQAAEADQSLAVLPQPVEQGVPEKPVISDETAAPFMNDNLPDWLQNLRPAEAAPAQFAEPPSRLLEQEAGLTPGELPGWVQAMRPIESVSPSQPVPPEVDQRMENIGPLAGIQGVLRAENILAGVKRPPIYSVKLQVTDKQRTNAALLESMLSQATEPQPVKMEKTLLSPRLLTAIVGIIMLLALWLPLGFNSQQMSLPAFIPAENLAFWDAVEQLPENSPVLVAVDYDTGMVGEMEAVGSSAVAHLMTKSANLVLLSTNPMGQILADRLVAQALTIRPEYPAADKTVNLGYLAGGAPALFNFVVDPNAISRLLSGSEQGWVDNLLIGPRPLWNFAQVVVITDNAETARAWIEQVQPQLGGKSMLVISSAQAAPMISPYADSRQIQGLVTGLVGGSIYEQLGNKPAFSRYYWDSYQAGLLFVIALIALGGMLGFGSAVINRQNNGA